MQAENDEDLRTTSVTLVLSRTNDYGAGSSSSNAEPLHLMTAKERAREWSTYNLSNNQTLVASLCFTKLEAMPKYVAMDIPIDLNRATIEWDCIKSRFNTKRIQFLFNTDRADNPHTSRGVLGMTIPENKETIPPVTSPIFVSQITELWTLRIQSTKTACACPSQHATFCAQNRNTIINVHPFLSALFQNIVQFTRHPSIGLQAIYNTIAQSAYYEELPAFTVATSSRLVLSKTVEILCQWTGFIIVVAILAAHVITVAFMVWLFATRTSKSLIGEMWHSVGQVMSDVPDHLVQERLGRTDG